MESPQAIPCHDASNRKRGRRLDLMKSPNQALRSQTSRPRRKVVRLNAGIPKQQLKELSPPEATHQNDATNADQITSTSTSTTQNNNKNEPKPVENCENFSPGLGASTAAAPPPPKTPTSSPTNPHMRSPIQSMLRQLQSDLSPKYLSPSTPSSSVRCSRYGRAQKSKESLEFIDTDMARAMRKSINDKSVSPTTKKNSSTEMESEELIYNVDLKRSPGTRKEYISPIQSLIQRNLVVRDVIVRTGHSPTNISPLGTDYNGKKRSRVTAETGVAQNPRPMTPFRVSPPSTHKIVDVDMLTHHKSPDTNQLDSLSMKKTVPSGTKKISHSPRRINIPMPPLFSESPCVTASVADSTAVQPASPTKAARKFVSPSNSPAKNDSASILFKVNDDTRADLLEITSDPISDSTTDANTIGRIQEKSSDDDERSVTVASTSSDSPVKHRSPTRTTPIDFRSLPDDSSLIEIDTSVTPITTESPSKVESIMSLHSPKLPKTSSISSQAPQSTTTSSTIPAASFSPVSSPIPVDPPLINIEPSLPIPLIIQTDPSILTTDSPSKPPNSPIASLDVSPLASPSTTSSDPLSDVFKKPSPKSYVRKRSAITASSNYDAITTSQPRQAPAQEENAVDFLLDQYPASPMSSPKHRRLLSLNKVAETHVRPTQENASESHIFEDSSAYPIIHPTKNEAEIDDKHETDVEEKLHQSFDGEACPSVSSEDSAKGSSIADEDPGRLERNFENYQVGDLAWARIGNYPYWPCLVCNSPEGVHISYTSGKKSQKRIHIRFLADNGRRSWTVLNGMMPFKSIEDFETKKRELPSNIKAKDPRIRAFTVKQAQMILWSQAIVEAQMLAVFSPSRRPGILEKKLDEDSKPKLRSINQKRYSTTSQDSFDSLLTETIRRNNTSTPCITSSHQSLDTLKPPETRLLSRSPTPESPEYEDLSINLPTSNGNEADDKIQNYLLSISNEAGKSPAPEHDRHDDDEVAAATDEANSMDVADNMIMMASDKAFLDYFQKTKHHFMTDSDTRNEVHLKHLALKMFMLQKLKDSNKQSGARRRNTTIDDDSLSEHEPVAKRKKVSADPPSKSGRTSAALNVRKSNRMSISEDKAKRISDAESDLVKKKDDEAKELATKVAMRVARAAEKEKRELEEMSKYFMNQYPKNILFKGLSRELVCRLCYKTGDLVKCHTTTCNEHVHRACASDPEAALAAISANKTTGRKPKVQPIGEDVYTMVHVTGDEDPQPMEIDCEPVYCPDCAPDKKPVCYVCKTNDGTELRCTEKLCGRQFHVACLKYWPQNKIVSDQQLLCPCHVCHTCISDDPRSKVCLTKNSKLTKCVKCPATYHIDSTCIPAGSQLLTSSQLICPRHRVEVRKPVNANWCFICSKGGNLVCCETCPTAFHAECLRLPVPDTCYICEECETGRYPLYGEIVWAKIGSCRWWPAVVVPPGEIPDTIMSAKRQPHNFAVRFFGSRNYSWISRGFVFLYQEDDSDYRALDEKPDKVFDRALVEVRNYARQLREINAKHVDPAKSLLHKPLPYTKIKTNRPIAPVRLSMACDSDEEPICLCRPNDDDPCGPTSPCLNRALFFECNAATCPAGASCQNQRFEKRLYPNLIERRTEGKGWGLVTLDAIPAGAFIIEYVGEVINQKEFQRRIEVMQQVKDEHYYFMTVNVDLMIDAGPRGNSARFINHSCEPNCETQYWQVKGNTRVGLFALADIPANTELTFNYNLECIGELKKICFCGAKKCAGFIGAKFTEPPKPAVDRKKGRGRKHLQKPVATKKKKKTKATTHDTDPSK